VVGAAVGVGRAVGIDVQAYIEVSDGLVRRCCTPDAYATLMALHPDARKPVFAAIWATQEACVKAAGTGLSGAPWRIPVPIGTTRGTWRSFGWQTVPTARDAAATCAYGGVG
jgi:4'-phosphopantetheinyl transferase